jgi:hypothetical protein
LGARLLCGLGDLNALYISRELHSNDSRHCAPKAQRRQANVQGGVARAKKPMV